MPEDSLRTNVMSIIMDEAPRVIFFATTVRQARLHSLFAPESARRKDKKANFSNYVLKV